MFKIENLSKSYGVNTVYENFCLDIEEGKITCILGASGCGKTTLLNCIANLTPYTGQIPKLKCSYIFQEPRLVPNLTVYKNLELVCKNKPEIDDILGCIQLSDKAEAYPVSLSGGQAQRVAIARAFLYGGQIMLMDEPFSSLDLKLKIQIIKLFQQIFSKRKSTALFVTHDIDEAVAVSNRIVVLDGGKIIFDTSGSEWENALSAPYPRTYGKGGELREKLISVLS